MTITTFNPLIASPKADEIIALLEELSFEKRHNIEGTNDESSFATCRMKHPEGFHADISKTEAILRDMTAIRMNVDNFEEAVGIPTANGFVNANGGKVTDLGSSKSVFMMSPSGFCISVVKHIKKEDRQ